MNRKLKKSKKLVVGDLRHRGPSAFRFGVNKGEVKGAGKRPKVRVANPFDLPKA